MSGGRKKSGFRITSVTSDYEQKDGPPPPGGEARAPASPKVSRGAAATEEDGPPEEDGARANGGGGAGARNGPSAPGSPGAAPSPPGAAASRFRVVKLDHGPGEPYRRGRWTCRDFYEQEVEQLRPAGRLADSARLPQSLDSRLEAAGLLVRPPGPFSPQPARRGAGPQAHLVLPAPGAPGHQARSLGGGLPALLRPHRTPPSPVSLRSPLAAAEAPLPAGGDGAKDSGEPGPGPGPGAGLAWPAEEQLLPKSVAQLMHRGTEERRRGPARESRSRPSSPAPPLFRDGSPSRRTSDPFGAARLSLARSVLGMGAAHDSDDESGASSSMIAIDNKIEQAMDLVKSHLMFAVREEVEELREQIRELSERNARLERENAALRSLANGEQPARPPARPPPAAPPDPAGAGGPKDTQGARRGIPQM